VDSIVALPTHHTDSYGRCISVLLRGRKHGRTASAARSGTSHHAAGNVRPEDELESVSEIDCRIALWEGDVRDYGMYERDDVYPEFERGLVKQYPLLSSLDESSEEHREHDHSEQGVMNGEEGVSNGHGVQVRAERIRGRGGDGDGIYTDSKSYWGCSQCPRRISIREDRTNKPCGLWAGSCSAGAWTSRVSFPECRELRVFPWPRRITVENICNR